MKSMRVCSAPRFLGEGELAAGDLDDDGDEVLGAIELEVVDLHGDGELGDGVAQHERVFELALLVGGGELAELPCRRSSPGGSRGWRRAAGVTVILMRRKLPSSAVLVV